MQKSLVVIYLQGGNDGLNVTVPVDTVYAGYQAARANIARVVGPSAGGKVGTWTMGGTGGSLGFANVAVSAAGPGDNGDPTLGFDSLYGDGSGGAGSDLAVFPAADYTPSNHSHFESADIWFGGSIEKQMTGWLGRWLDTYGSPVNPLQAVSIDDSLSKQIRTAKAPVCALRSLRGARFDLPGVDRQTVDPTQVMQTLASRSRGTGNDHLARARGAYGLTVDMANRLEALTNTAPGLGYPLNSNLSSQLQTAAVLLGAGLGTRLVTIDWGGFDTHGSQLASQDPQLKDLSRSLAAFKADLTARGIENQVLTLVFSEFGRRVGSNDSGGTDHGAGGMMLVSGSAVRGGLAGEFPDAADDRPPGVRPDRQDRLPHGLPGAHRRVARRRPCGDPARRPLRRHPALRRRHEPDQGCLTASMHMTTPARGECPRGARRGGAAPRRRRWTLSPATIGCTCRRRGRAAVLARGRRERVHPAPVADRARGRPGQDQRLQPGHGRPRPHSRRRRRRHAAAAGQAGESGSLVVALKPGSYRSTARCSRDAAVARGARHAQRDRGPLSPVPPTSSAMRISTCACSASSAPSCCRRRATSAASSSPVASPAITPTASSSAARRAPSAARASCSSAAHDSRRRAASRSSESRSAWRARRSA